MTPQLPSNRPPKTLRTRNQVPRHISCIFHLSSPKHFWAKILLYEFQKLCLPQKYLQRQANVWAKRGSQDHSSITSARLVWAKSWHWTADISCMKPVIVVIIGFIKLVSHLFVYLHHPIPQGFSIIIVKPYVKAVTHSEKLEWWIILMVDRVAILHKYRAKWLHNPPLKYSTIQFFQNV